MRHHLGISILCLLSTTAIARFAQVETKSVPLARLLKNLEAQSVNADTLGRRARLHAMAYASGSSSVTVRADAPDKVWEGYQPQAAPFRGEKSKPTIAGKASLERSIELYRKALAEAPSDTRLQLGLGWCLIESGDAAGARSVLDKAFDAAWAKEQNESSAWRGQMLAEEIASYLRPLLDRKNDASRLAELDRRIAVLERLPRKVTPIVLPLGKPTALDALVDRNARVAFDLDGTGAACRWQWVSDDAGWLVWDPEQSGRIDSGLQLFGAVTFWLFWNDGYEALCGLDDDGDGRVRGSELAGLAVWRKDGVVLPLAKLQITELRCDRGSVVKTNDVATHPRGMRFADGREAPTYDWIAACR